MATQTLRPTSVSGSAFTASSGTLTSCLNDNSDATYDNASLSSGSAFGLSGALGDLSALPANSQLRSVQPFLRELATTVVAGARWSVRLSHTDANSTFLAYADEYVAANSTTARTTGFTARTVKADGSDLSTQYINELTFDIQADASNAGSSVVMRALDFWAVVTYNEAPVATPAAPNGNVTTSRPTFVWTYSDPELDRKERHRVRVFSDAQYGAVGFDPNTTTPLVDSGEIYTESNAWTCPVSLPNHHTYRAFIQVCDVGSNGRYSTISAAGPYCYATIQLVSLAAPILDAVPSDLAGTSVELLLRGRDNALSSQTSDLDDTTGIGNWVSPGTNCTAARLTGQSSAITGTNVLEMNVTANGDALLLTGHVAADDEERWASTWILASTAGRQCRIELHWFDAGGSEIDVTYGANTFCFTTTPVPLFVRGACASGDAASVAIGVRVLAGVANNKFKLDASIISTGPINEFVDPAFDSDLNNDGLADGWALSNTGGGTLPTPSIDRSKVFGGDASQRLDWNDSNNGKGIKQLNVDIPSNSTKKIQIAVAVDYAGADTVLVTASHPYLPDYGPYEIVCDGSWQVISIRATNTGTTALAPFTIECTQGGQVSMWVGMASMDVPGDVSGDSAGVYDPSVGFGIVMKLMSGAIAHGGALPDRRFELERSTNAGATWELINAATTPTAWHYSDLSDVAPDDGQILRAYDFLAPRGVDVVYRGRSIATFPSGDIIASQWSHWVHVQVSSVGWWLKSLTDPTYAVSISFDWESFNRDKPIDTSEYEPIDSDETIIVQGRTRGERLNGDLTFATNADWELFDGLRDRKETMLLQDSTGRQWHVRFAGDRSAKERKWRDSPDIERKLPIKFVEVSP